MLKYIACAIDFAATVVRANRNTRHTPRSSGRAWARIEGLESRLLLSTDEPTASINTPTTWAAAGSPYNLTGTVTIAAGGSLTIQSGVMVTHSNIIGAELDVASGGTLSANTVDFEAPVVAKDGSLGSVANSTFGESPEFDLTSLTITSDVFNANPTVDPTYVPNLGAGGNTFASGTVVNVNGQSVNVPVSWPLITNVTSYNVTGNVNVVSGGALTIANGVMVTHSNVIGAGLTIATGGMLTADTVDFECSVTAHDGSLGSVDNSTFGVSSEFDATSITLSNDVFNANPTVDPTFVPTLAANGNTFVSGTVVNVNAQSVNTSITWPLIMNVASYNLGGTVNIVAGGSLTIGNNVTLTHSNVIGSKLEVSTGGSVSAVEVNFNCVVDLGPGSTGLLEYDTFVLANGLLIDGTSTVTIHNDDFSNATATVSSQGTGGPINLEMNWWGVTTDQLIAAKITDFSDNPMLPVIDHSLWLTAAPVFTGVIVETQPTNQTVPAGQMASFTAAAIGSPTPTVQWQVSTDGTTYTNITGATSATYTFTAAMSQTGDLFRAVFTNSQGTGTTNPATLTVTAAGTAPVITVQPVAQSVGVGQSVSFVAAGTGSPFPTVQWQVSADAGLTYTNVAGATSRTYTFAPTIDQSGDLFRAVFTNTLSTATTTPALLTVSSATAPVVTLQPVNQSAINGQDVSFTATATGIPTPTVQWQVSTDGLSYSNIPGQVSSTYAFIATTAQSGDQYRAVFSNSQGSATSSPAALTVTSATTSITITRQPGAQNAQIGQAVSFTAAATGTPTPSVQWQVSTDGTTYQNIPGATSLNYTFVAAQGENGNHYRAFFTNSAGSVATSPALLSVAAPAAPPTVTITAPNITSAGGNAQTVTVVYSGTSASINTSTIAGSNITVTGPTGQVLVASVFNVYVSGTSATVTYVITPPNGVWQASDDGSYSVVVKPGVVKDVNGLAATGSGTSFTVNANTELVVTVTSSDNATIAGQPATFIATLTGARGNNPDRHGDVPERRGGHRHGLCQRRWNRNPRHYPRWHQRACGDRHLQRRRDASGCLIWVPAAADRRADARRGCPATDRRYPRDRHRGTEDHHQADHQYFQHHRVEVQRTTDR